MWLDPMDDINSTLQNLKAIGTNLSPSQIDEAIAECSDSLSAWNDLIATAKQLSNVTYNFEAPVTIDSKVPKAA